MGGFYEKNVPSGDDRSGGRRGPSSDAHAGGFREKNRSPMHRYLKVKGGFLAVAVERVDDIPQIRFQHYGTAGNLYHEDVMAGK
jgi:alkaline phosphatase D